MKLIQWLDKMEYKLLQGTLDLEVGDVIYDSRKAKDETVFVCMMGSRIDSHDFIDDVVQKGVKAIVTEKDLENLPDGITVIRVDNSRKALALLSAARFGYPAEKMTTIGVTGTKGKTTTTHMIKAILETAGKKSGDDRNHPTRNTTPESYELQEYFSKMVEAGCEYMIMEVSSQGLKMHRVDGIFFDYGLFTNISPDHIGPDEHADFEEYLYYKSQLLNRCRIGIVNRDDAHYEETIRSASCICHTFSLDQDASFMAKDIRYVAEADFVGLDFKVTGEYEIELKVNIPGRFNVYNALAAVSVCSFLGLPKDKICHALEHLSVNGRMEIVYAKHRQFPFCR